MSRGAIAGLAAVGGALLGIVVAITTSVPLAPELGAVLGGGTGWMAAGEQRMSKPIRIEETVRIERDAAEVWEAIADYEYDFEWREGLTEMTPTPPGPAAMGTRVHEVVRSGGRDYAVDAAITEFQPGASYRFEGSGTLGGHHRRPRGPAGCRRVRFHLPDRAHPEGRHAADAPAARPDRPDGSAQEPGQAEGVARGVRVRKRTARPRPPVISRAMSRFARLSTPLFVCMAALIASPIALAKPGDVFVGLNSGGQVQVQPNGTSTGKQRLVGSGSPYDQNGGGDFASDGTLYVSDYGAGGILKANLKDKTAKVVASGSPFNSVSDVEYSPDGFLYASDFGERAIYRINPKTKHVSTLTHDGLLTDATYTITVGPSGNIYTVDQNGHVVRVNPENRHQKLISSDPDVGAAYGIAVSVDGESIYTLADEPNGVTRIDPSKPAASNAMPLGMSLFTSPYDLAWDLKGNLLGSDDNGNDSSVIRINPKTGQQRHLYSGGPQLNSTEGITVEPPTCGGKTATLYGTPKDDHIKASPYRDVIAGLGGDDKIDGAGGKDIICGNGGKDKLIGSGGRDHLIGGPGRDTTRQ